MGEPYWPDRPRVLASYAYAATVKRALQIPGADVMIDSGAFTAHTTGKTINLPEYCEWINAHAERITTAVVLDVIGDWKGTARNTDRMMDLVDTDRVTVLPVWHQTSPINELERMCREHDYIGIGGLVSGARNVKTTMQHLIRIHKVARRYGTRLHGLGVTGKTSMARLPWGTVDSSTWSHGSRFGKLVLYDRSGHQNYMVAGQPIKDRNERALIRTYGGDPERFTRPGFCLQAGGNLHGDREWMLTAEVRSYAHYEGVLRRKHQNEARIYLALATNYQAEAVAKGWSMGSPFGSIPPAPADHRETISTNQ